MHNIMILITQYNVQDKIYAFDHTYSVIRLLPDILTNEIFTTIRSSVEKNIYSELFRHVIHNDYYNLF